MASCLDCLRMGDRIVLGATVYTVDGVRKSWGVKSVLVAAYGWVPVALLARNGWRLRSSVALDAAVAVEVARELYRGEG